MNCGIFLLFRDIYCCFNQTNMAILTLNHFQLWYCAEVNCLITVSRLGNVDGSEARRQRLKFRNENRKLKRTRLKTQFTAGSQNRWQCQTSFAVYDKKKSQKWNRYSDGLCLRTLSCSSLSVK